MLRLVLLLVYLIASSASLHTTNGSGTDSGGLTTPPLTDGGSGADPLG